LSAFPESISVHPCYSAEAHWKYARMHLPVAPACNIQCRFCNRAFDCSNETRPGVTSKVLKAEEAAALVHRVRERLGNLSVIGIAGPGEPLANEETFKTLRLVGGEFPDMTLCLATNGLLLPERVDELVSLGVKYVTVTINALEPRVGAEIYSWVRDGGETLTGQDAFQTLSGKQWDGLAKCVDEGLIVKVNSVLIPGINEEELPKIALRASEAGALVQNVIPFLPVKGSEFEDRKAPGRLETNQVREECGRLIKQIEHCARCRADAIGLLGCDISSAFY
jgi:nitrogen fixation protein NifB